MRIKLGIPATCLILFLLSQLLFLINIQFPRTPNFDEFHYIPSAKQFLALTENQNYEHPPLGKELIAISIAIGGDRPIGWRLMSTFFGALTLVGMYLWGLAVFRDRKAALFTAILTLFNQLLYVQARIGMLDTFMFAFMVYALAAFCSVWTLEIDAKTARKRLLFTGAMFGFSMACKWFAVLPLAVAVGMIGLVRVLQSWRTVFLENPKLAGNRNSTDTVPDFFDDWYHPDLLKDLRLRDLALAFIAMPLFCYYLTFIPFFFIHGQNHNLYEILFTMQYKMWDGQMRVVSPHPYTSTWTEWPLMLRPIWYAFDKEGSFGEWVRGVILLGNPLIMWGGLIALAICVADWIQNKSREAFLIVAIYAGLYLSWAVIPRKISFYYYYYPAGMTLSLAIAYVFSRWAGHVDESRLAWARGLFLAAAISMFIYFFPILAALKIHGDQFRQWMWLTRWI